MKKALLRTMLLLCALVVGGSSAWAETTTTINFEDNKIPTGWTNTNDMAVVSNPVSNTSSTNGSYCLSTNGKASNSLTSGYIENIVSISVDATRTSNNTTNEVYIDFCPNTLFGKDDTQTQSVTVNKNSWSTSTLTLYEKASGYVRIRRSGGTSTATKFIDNIVITCGTSTPTTYEVYFYAGAGTFVGNEDFPDGDNEVAAGTYTLPTPMAPNGSTFDGWKPNGGTGLFTGSYEVTEDVLFEAQYTNPTAPVCTIDPTSYDFGTVAIGTPATKTFTVTTANLTGDVTLSIDGDDEFTVSPTAIAQGATSTEVTVTFTPTSAGVSAAQLKANGSGFVNHALATVEGTGAQSYTVTFNPGNGTCATESTTELDGTEIDLPTATPNAVCQEAGWTFAGWATASVASGSTTATLLPSKYTVTENITLYAVYQLTNEDGGSVTFDFGDIAATTEGWINGTAHTTVEISPITLTANGGGNNGKYYDSDETWRMYNGGSVSITSVAGAITSVISNPSTTFTITNGSASQSFAATTMFKSITVNYETATFASSPVAIVAKPEIIGTTPFYGSTEVTITCGTAGATIQYSTDDGANWNTYTAPFNINTTTTVKAKGTKTNWTDSEVAEKTFTAITPLTVTAALTAINAFDNGGTIAEQYVKGYVSTTGSLNDKGQITYSISVDGSATNELVVYNGKGLNNANFTAASDIALGDEVVIYGTLQKYEKNGNITPEFTGGNYLFHKNRHPAPDFSLDPTSKSLDAYTHETVDVTLTTNTDGAITCESSDEDVATVALKSAGVYTITAQTAGTATITIKSAVSANYAPASATVAITVTDDREDAEISFANATVTKTWGQSFTGQALTNTHGVDVVWSSTDEAVATVDNTGVVTVLKAGSTDIKATFAGDATYKAAVVSYALTVNKANAGLSYATTSFDIMLNDDSFVAPTLNNPNGLIVTYASNNTDVALVGENDGVLVYEESAAGTATITATFAGNDWYKSGSASYTINIIDPTVKGCKYNPYTVAEVIAMAPTSTSAVADGQGDIYVTGYIVGEYRNSNATTTTVLQSSFTTDANIAIADDPTTTALASSIPVNLPNADQKEFGNNTNNGKTIGCKVLVKGDVLKYFGAPGFKNIDEISAVSVAITPTKNYTTLTSKFALDFTGQAGLEAYIVEDNDLSDNAVTLTQVNKVPANTGLVLKASIPGTAVNVPVFDGTGADDVTGNLMKGSATTTTAVAENAGYILKDGVFQPSSGANALPAGKAYLNIAVSSAPFLSLDFGNDATNIADVRSKMEDVKGEVYNLNGQRVAQPTKGLYIVNGRKVVIK